MMRNVPQVWNVDKKISIPLFQQLADNIKWSVTLGGIAPGETLPSLRLMSRELGVSVDTVRSAYKLLEETGLVATRPHLGTVIKSRYPNPAPQDGGNDAAGEGQALSGALLSYMEKGKSEEEIRAIVEPSPGRAVAQTRHEEILFIECDDAYAATPARDLTNALGVKIRFINTHKLKAFVPEFKRTRNLYTAIITTYFHYASTMQVFTPFHIPVFGVVLEFDPETLRAISKLEEKRNVAVIGDRRDFIEYHAGQIETMRDDLTIRSAGIEDGESFEAVLEWADVFFIPFSLRARIMGIRPDAEIHPLCGHINAQSIGLVQKMLGYLDR